MPGPTEPLGQTSSHGASGRSGGIITAGSRIVFSVESRAPNGAWNVVIRPATGSSPVTATVFLKTGVETDLIGATVSGRVIAVGRHPTIELIEELGKDVPRGVFDARTVDAVIRILSSGGLPVTDALVSLLRSARTSDKPDQRSLWLLGVFRDKGFELSARDLEDLPGFIHHSDRHDSSGDRRRDDSNRRREKGARRDELLRGARNAIRRAADSPESTLQYFNHARGSGYHWIIVPFALETDAGRIDATLTAALLPHRKSVAGARLVVTHNESEYSFAWKPPPAGELELFVTSIGGPAGTREAREHDRTVTALKGLLGPRGFTRISVRDRSYDDGFSIPGVRGIIPRIDESV